MTVKFGVNSSICSVSMLTLSDFCKNSISCINARIILKLQIQLILHMKGFCLRFNINHSIGGVLMQIFSNLRNSSFSRIWTKFYQISNSGLPLLDVITHFFPFFLLQFKEMVLLFCIFPDFPPFPDISINNAQNFISLESSR